MCDDQNEARSPIQIATPLQLIGTAHRGLLIYSAPLATLAFAIGQTLIASVILAGIFLVTGFLVVAPVFKPEAFRELNCVPSNEPRPTSTEVIITNQ